MSHFTRRQFVKAAAAGLGLLPAMPRCCLPPGGGPVSFAGTDIVPLGKTGIKVSRLAQGTGYNGYNHTSAHTRQGKEAFDRLLRHSIDEGIRSSTWRTCTVRIRSSRTKSRTCRGTSSSC